ncbi:MAG TPA: phosphoglycerate kinase [Candidatus Aminicenantes bacterium]|nr:phosphoglycerate kinase [Candidatus Aminicenantes bacterium]HRY66218.1 phosphoglycerate kinase [Candidatus Aminicenantes bacterium]HRZ73132.1 phosphoglycerate kinase [Candidatus Aminicenantes bacterium]
MNFVTDLDVKGKLVFLRVDFNVPLDDKGQIRDDNRIRASLPTINWLLEHGARVVIASHMGRPKGKFEPSMSLKPAAKRLAELIPNKVLMAPDVVGDEVERLKKGLAGGEALLLENVRFYKEEEKNDPAFARRLAEGIDIFVNDAFGSSHRAHASVVGIADFVPVKAAGYLMKKEVDYLKKAVHTPVKPYVAILGGAKVSDKIEIIESLLGKADHILIGGAMAYTFLKAQGLGVGKSLVEDDQIEVALSILDKARTQNVSFHLPQDHLLAKAPQAGAETKIVESLPFPDDMMGVDIGPKTVAAYAAVIAMARTIFWNGPMGIFEIDEFAKGTIGLAKAVAASGAVSIVGGGDSAAAVKKAGVRDKISHISTGGGASLEYVAYETLPGITALEK